MQGGSEPGATEQPLGSELGGQSQGVEKSICRWRRAGASILSCPMMGYASRLLWCDVLFVNKVYSTCLCNVFQVFSLHY